VTARMAQTGAQIVEPRRPAPNVTVLIVEDDILPAMALRDEFEEAGYHVLDLTGRHDEALAAARTGKPDMALVNIQLQGRDDGIALAHDLKAMGIPTLFISGQVSRASSERTAAIGSFPKPYRTTEMVEAVAYLLHHLQGGDMLHRPEGLEVFDQAPAATHARGEAQATDPKAVAGPTPVGNAIPRPQVVSPPQEPGEAKVPELPARPPE
jgi:DNA-binding response OmpR family regulator